MPERLVFVSLSHKMLMQSILSMTNKTVILSPDQSLQAFERVGKPRKEFDRAVCGLRPEAEGMGNDRVH